MTATQAKIVEWAIILLCVFSLFAIFQPFSLTLFSVGCVTVVVGALSFNLIPFCRPGVPAQQGDYSVAARRHLDAHTRRATPPSRRS